MSNNRVVTPWNKHFVTGTHAPPLNNEELSWLDPMFPSMDPVTLRLDPPGTSALPKPSPAELDDLFLSERLQKYFMYGLTTWEAAILASAEAYTAYDESDHTTANDLRVDETSWLRVWQKYRWRIDFVQEKHWTGHPGRHWTVDDPVIWTELRKCIQLADNILRVTATEPWLRMLLSKDGIESVKVELPFGSGNWEQIWRVKNDNSFATTTQAVLDYFDDPEFYTTVMWALKDSSCNFMASDISASEVGTTHEFYNAHRRLSPITLDIVYLQTMLDPSTTAVSKRMALHLQALTIVHELMFGAREYVAEMGHSWEASAFGGTLFGIEAHDTGSHCRSSNAAGVIAGLISWPNINHRNLHETYGIALGIPTYRTTWPAPAIWIASFRSQDFWTKIVPKYGPGALKMPKPLVDVAVYEDPFKAVSGAVPSQAKWVAGYIPPEWNRKSLSALARRLTARRRAYQTRRPWFPDAFAMWQMTPWSWTDFRHELHDALNIHFVRRGIVDQLFLQSLIVRLIHPLILEITPAGRAKMHVPPDYTHVNKECGVQAWFFRAIGVLIAAALPAHDGEVVPEREPSHYRNPTPWKIKASVATALNSAERSDLFATMAYLYKHRYTFAGFQMHKRHQAPDPPKNRLNLRRDLIELAVCCWESFEAVCDLPLGLRGAFFAAVNDMTAQLKADLGNDYRSWLDLTFRMPEYAGVWEDGRTTGLEKFTEALKDGWDATSPMFGEEAVVRFNGEPVKDPSHIEVEPHWAIGSVGIAGDVVPVDQRPVKPNFKYFTASQIYDQATAEGKPLLIAEEGIHLNIFLASDVKQLLGNITEEQLNTITSKEFNGRQLKPEAVNLLRQAAPDIVPLARAMRLWREDEIALCDGKNGNPFCVRIADSIFDLTDVDHLDNGDQKDRIEALEILKSTPGGNPSQKLLQAGFFPRTVSDLISPYRIGYVQPSVTRATHKHHVRTFTGKTLRRYEFLDCCMYVAIEGKVYNITNYVMLHPGGEKLLAEYGGRDITELFNKYHPETKDKLIEDLQAVHIGRMVENRSETVLLDGLPSPEVVRGDEILFRNEIYSVRALIDSAENFRLVEALRPYLGKDASQALANEDDNHGPLTTFARMKGFIVAMTEPEKTVLRNMSIMELRGFDRQKGHLAYVAVDGLIYDVTDVIDFGQQNQNYANLRNYVGHSIQGDDVLADYVKNNCEHRLCARLVTFRHVDGGAENFTWNPDGWKRPDYKLPLWGSGSTPQDPPSPEPNEVAPHLHFQMLEDKYGVQDFFDGHDSNTAGEVLDSLVHAADGYEADSDSDSDSAQTVYYDPIGAARYGRIRGKTDVKRRLKEKHRIQRLRGKKTPATRPRPDDGSVDVEESVCSKRKVHFAKENGPEKRQKVLD
ncbi:cytochrome b5-like heme steroid binding domain-containing protein [Colletotrichum kahawae]|uniref:Cytochrome b5-like heme steroid binding domain-containing protein n=1 Tax=Colletotrichum kahawae TaxID=34407 RepID=A0AAD9YGE7_COLKA|nr:cytochrome b5-like heme steroid binding domain-containing protein [Colletotrichum kahawae]